MIRSVSSVFKQTQELCSEKTVHLLCYKQTHANKESKENRKKTTPKKERKKMGNRSCADGFLNDSGPERSCMTFQNVFL